MIPVALFHNGVSDPSQATEAELTAAGDALVELIDLVDIRLPDRWQLRRPARGEIRIHQAWSGDLVNSSTSGPVGGMRGPLDTCGPPRARVVHQVGRYRVTR